MTEQTLVLKQKALYMPKINELKASKTFNWNAINDLNLLETKKQVLLHIR